MEFMKSELLALLLLIMSISTILILVVANIKARRKFALDVALVASKFEEERGLLYKKIDSYKEQYLKEKKESDKLRFQNHQLRTDWEREKIVRREFFKSLNLSDINN